MTHWQSLAIMVEFWKMARAWGQDASAVNATIKRKHSFRVHGFDSLPGSTIACTKKTRVSGSSCFCTQGPVERNKIWKMLTFLMKAAHKVFVNKTVIPNFKKWLRASDIPYQDNLVQLFSSHALCAPVVESLQPTQYSVLYNMHWFDSRIVFGFVPSHSTCSHHGNTQAATNLKNQKERQVRMEYSYSIHLVETAQLNVTTLNSKAHYTVWLCCFPDILWSTMWLHMQTTQKFKT